MSSLVRTATLGAEPITLAYMKNALKIPTTITADDVKITRLIKAARQHCELLTNAALVRSTFVQYMHHFPYWRTRDRGYFQGQVGEHHHLHHGEIKIKRPPLVSVQSLVYIGTDGRDHTLNPGQDFIVDIASRPGSIRPIPYTVWPLTLNVANAVAIAFTAGYAPGDVDTGQTTIPEPETLTAALPPSWKPITVQAQYSFVIDPSGNVEVQENSGTPSTGAGPGQPTWPAPGATVSDGGCLWKNVGPIRGFWTPDTPYSGRWVVLDFNSNLQLLNVAALTSQTVPPESLAGVGDSPLPWATALGGLTADNGIAAAWMCLGPYRALGNNGASAGNSPEQQAAVTVDLSLPDTAPLAMEYLVSHWYFNRDAVVPGPVVDVPHTVLDLLGEVTLHDFAPTPDE